MELENVLLIGGSGFVGGWIASCLSERGIRVTIPTRRRDNTKKLIMLPMVSMVEAKCARPAGLVRLMQGQDAVINLVGILHDMIRACRMARVLLQRMSTCRERSSPPCGKAAFAVWCT
jgi:uncharacterized protein YbjT (DUF2867 family)